MTGISKEAVDALSAELHEWSEYEAAEVLVALRAALDEAEARAVKAEAERDSANILAALEPAAPDPAAYNRGHEDCLYQRGDAPDPAAIREAALQLAVTAVRQALVDAAHAHRAEKSMSSAMFKAETYATNAILALIPKGAAE